MPLQQLAGFSVPEARLLVVSPYDKASMAAIEKAIRNSDLGLNPSNDGVVIRLAFPPLTEERRKELREGGEAHGRGRQGRGAQPAPRGAARPRGLEKDGDIVRATSSTRAEKELDKLTHDHTRPTSTGHSTHKEHELLEV